MREKLDLSTLPEEVTDYAFDQMEDRLNDEAYIREAMETVMVDTEWDCKYGTQKFIINPMSIHLEILRDALHEKVRDIEYEIEHGEIPEDKYDVSVEYMRQVIDDLEVNNFHS